MTRRENRWTAWAIVALAVAFNAIVLAPDIEIGRVNLNDTVFHFTIVDAVVQRVAHGQSPLDFWMPEWSFGYPVVRDYQPFGHWLVAAIHFLTGRQFELDWLFSFIRYLLLVLFPISAFVACRATGLRAMTAAAAAALTPLVASPNLYGIEYGSYVWRGNGLFTQLVATHFFVLAIGVGCAAIRRGRGISAAGALLALTFLSHFIYGYMAAATLIVVAALPGGEDSPIRRVARLAWVGALSFALAAFQIVPMLQDGPFINRSRWEPAWKWDSFGFAQVFGLTASGNLLDAQRLPIVSLLALFGAIAVVRRSGDDDDSDARFAQTFAFAGAALWLILFCGRAAWGSLFRAIGLSDAAQLHRFIGGAQWFLLILAGIGLARLWTLPRERGWRHAGVAAVALTVALLWFPLQERRHYLDEGYEWGRANLASYETYRAEIAQTIATVHEIGGRTYPGLAAQWGAQFRVGYVPFYAFLSEAHAPAVAFLYHSMALPADIQVRFNEQRADHYRLFDVRSAVSETNRAMAPFLTPLANIGAFRVHRAPTSGEFDVVHVAGSAYVDRNTYYDVSDAWLQSGWVAAGEHLLLDYEQRLPTANVARLADLGALGRAPIAHGCGRVTMEERRGDAHRAEIEVTSDGCFALFKMTYHPRWQARVDGATRTPVMLTPGFIGVPLTRGRHVIEMEYQGSVAKLVLLIAAIPLFLTSFFVERKGGILTIERPARWWNVDVRYALLVAILILPAVAPYVGSLQPNGHDALEYLPRVTEFHENIRHGILLPRWAPDLSSGQGQPLFLLNPPLFYYVTELFHLAGLPFVPAMNAACVLLLLASAAAMFLLGRWYFGAPGGAIAAVAYIYAPYFLVDLYVRTAFSEFSAFPFYPLAIYGFARHAESRRGAHLLIGIAAYAAIWYAHTPAALLFSPLLGAFLIFTAWRARDVRLLLRQAAAATLAFLLAASVWLPSLVESADTHANRLTEGALQYSSHFVAPHQFFSNAWGYGLSLPGDQDGMPFSLGWAQLAIAAAAALMIARSSSERWKHWIAFFAVAAFVQCFLMTQRAHALWDAVPQLHYVAFPWRLLAPTAFCLALLTAAIALALRELPVQWQRLAFVAVIAALVFPALKHTQPQSYLSLDPLQWTPRQIAARGIVAGTFDTFEPRWIETRPVDNGGAIRVNRGNASARVTQRTPTRLAASITASTAAELELPISHFPGWRVRIDGTDTPLDLPSSSGRIRVSIAAGAHQLEAAFTRTPVRWAADAISLAALFLAIGWFLQHDQIVVKRARP